MSDLLLLADELRRLRGRLDRLEAQEHLHPQYLRANGSQAGGTAAAQAFEYPVITPGMDVPLQHAVDSSHFNDNTATYPAGWTQVVGATATNTNTPLGYWYLSGSAALPSWKYRRRLAALSAASTSLVFGPILWRDPVYTGDVTYAFGMYRDDGAGNCDETQYNVVELNYVAASNLWRMRSVISNGATTSASAYVDLQRPLLQGLFFRVSTTGSNNNKRGHYGTWPQPIVHTTFQNIVLAITWNTPWMQISMVRGAGLNDVLLFGGFDRTADA